MRKSKVGLRTEYMLKYEPKTRDSDRVLLLDYWGRQGLVLTDDQKQKFLKCDKAESITRARRALREKYPSSKQVEDRRREEEQRFRDNYGTGDPL